MAIDPDGSRLARAGRLLRRARLIVFLALLVTPLVQAAWVVHVQGDAPVDLAPATSQRERARVAVRRAEYLAQRESVVDKLLPEGSGGTGFSEHLGGLAGVASLERAAIGLSATADLGDFPEAVELHERAHLVDGFLPAAVAALMARVPPAAADEYAATNPGEHFAEMAGQAWTMIAPAKNMSIDRTPADLTAIEARVPGTAGFVAYFLRRGDFDERDLGPIADRLSAPYRAELDTILSALDARRRSDGTFTPWRNATMRGYLERQRDRARASSAWFDRAFLVLMQPSLMIVRVLG